MIQDDIVKPLQSLCPMFSNLIDELYSNQIRNAVAHSQYFHLYDSINFTNKDQNSNYKLTGISFDDWEKLFTRVMLLYNYLIKNFNKYQSIYQEEVKEKQNGLLVCFPEKDLKGLQKTGWLKYNFDHKRWYRNQ